MKKISKKIIISVIFWIIVIFIKGKVNATSISISPSSPKVGDTVTMNANATVYGKSTKFSAWVYKSTLYVRAISDDKITVSILKTGAVTGTVDRKYLTKK